VNLLQQNHAEEIENLLAKFPPDQKHSAVMPLLFLAQRESGYITKQAIDEIAEILSVSATEVASVVGFYSLFNDKPEGQVRIQVCTDLSCSLRGAEEFLNKLCQNLGIRVGETTPDGKITVEAVMCLAGCDKAPVFQSQTSDSLNYHENQTVESAMRLINSWR
jgi:NADH-quinone oxidoreductase subunit E